MRTSYSQTIGIKSLCTTLRTRWLRTKRESTHWMCPLRTKTKLCKNDVKDLPVSKILQRPPRTTAKILMKLKSEITSWSKSYGVNSSSARCQRKWTSTLQLNRLSRKSNRLQVTQTYVKWSTNFCRGSKCMLYWETRLTKTSRSMKGLSKRMNKSQKNYINLRLSLTILKKTWVIDQIWALKSWVRNKLLLICSKRLLMLMTKTKLTSSSSPTKYQFCRLN